MGFFKEMFSGHGKTPELDAASPAAKRLAEMSTELDQLYRQAHDRLEVIPGSQRSWVFIGKPPKKFGLAWIEGNQVKNLKNLVNEKGLPPERMTRIVEELREAYLQSASEPRYEAQVAGKRVRVAPSPRLEHEVEEIIHRAEA